MSESTKESKRCVCGNFMGQWTNLTMGCQACGRRETTKCDKPGHLGATEPGKGFYCYTCKESSNPISPSHYVKRGIEVRKVIAAWELTYHCGDALAYILRAKFKGNYAEDLRKAIQHLQFELEEHGGGDGVGGTDRSGSK